MALIRFLGPSLEEDHSPSGWSTNLYNIFPHIGKTKSYYSGMGSTRTCRGSSLASTIKPMGDRRCSFIQWTNKDTVRNLLSVNPPFPANMIHRPHVCLIFRWSCKRRPIKSIGSTGLFAYVRIPRTGHIIYSWAGKISVILIFIYMIFISNCLKRVIRYLWTQFVKLIWFRNPASLIRFLKLYFSNLIFVLIFLLYILLAPLIY